MWPDLAIYWTFGNFLKPLAKINLPKCPKFLGNFVKALKCIIFLVKSFLGNFYRLLAIFSGHTEYGTSCFLCLESAALLMLNEQQFYMFGQIQTSQKRGGVSHTGILHPMVSVLWFRYQHWLCRNRPVEVTLSRAIFN